MLIRYCPHCKVEVRPNMRGDTEECPYCGRILNKKGEEHLQWHGNYKNGL